jgi:hypothetical protein
MDEYDQMTAVGINTVAANSANLNSVNNSHIIHEPDLFAYSLILLSVLFFIYVFCGSNSK